MNLYLLSIDSDDYDMYEGAVVAAETEEIAKRIHPDGDTEWNEYDQEWIYDPHNKGWSTRDTWNTVKYVKCEYIGKAKDGTKRGVIFNAFYPS